MKKNTFLIISFLLAVLMPSVTLMAASPLANTALSGEAPVVDSEAENSYEKFVSEIYDINDLRRLGLEKDIFKRAMVGFFNLQDANQVSSFKSILTVIDFTKSGKKKRLWVIDLKRKKLLYHTLVAHGRGSGGDKPYAFSNEESSHQSSVGFYVTGSTYTGKHGLSLKLDGMDQAFNSNARERAIVVHGASYVNEAFVKQNGYLGRSHGCPALPEALTATIINIIKDKTVLYIEGPVKSYTSVYLNRNKAIAQFSSASQKMQASL